MTTEPLTAGDTHPDFDCQLATIVVLSANIEALTVFRDIVEATSVKAVFESVIAIITLVRVRLLTLFPSPIYLSVTRLA